MRGRAIIKGVDFTKRFPLEVEGLDDDGNSIQYAFVDADGVFNIGDDFRPVTVMSDGDSIYQVTVVTKGDTSAIYESPDIDNARARYLREMSYMTPADVTGWPDNDTAWNTVCRVELNRIVFDEEGEVADVESVELSDYFEL